MRHRVARTRAAARILAILAVIAGGCSSAASTAAAVSDAAPAPFYANRFDKTPTVAAMTAVGRALFMDPGLSASGKLACASCHDPAHA